MTGGRANLVAIMGFCTSCQRTVYRGSGDPEYCPVCSSPLLIPQEDATRALEEKIVENEAAYRSLNEVVRFNGGSQNSEISLFHCECGRPDCTERLKLSAGEYESVRADPRRFFIVPGHNIEGVEAVVERQPNHWTVEKIGHSGAIAEACDPRKSA
jgi:hypothetical protein